MPQWSVFLVSVMFQEKYGLGLSLGFYLCSTAMRTTVYFPAPYKPVLVFLSVSQNEAFEMAFQNRCYL